MRAFPGFVDQAAHERLEHRAGRAVDRRAFVRWAIAAAAAAATLGGPGRAPARSRWWSSLVFGVFENHGFDEVAGLPSHRRLAREGTVLARYFAVAHPSGPNYRAMISGATWGNRETIDTFHPSVGSEAAAQVGACPEEQGPTYGNSIIVDPWGEVLARADGESPGFVSADLDFPRQEEIREKLPSLANRVPDDPVVKSVEASPRFAAGRSANTANLQP